MANQGMTNSEACQVVGSVGVINVELESAGHWEGDLVVGQRNQSAIGTLVERTSRYTKLVAINGRDNAAEFAQRLIEAFEKLPGLLCGSLTRHQGSELSDHETFTKATQH